MKQHKIETGALTAELALLVTLVATIAIPTVMTVGLDVNDNFHEIHEVANGSQFGTRQNEKKKAKELEAPKEKKKTATPLKGFGG